MDPVGVRGWLLALCLLLVVWQPLDLALVASHVVDAIAVRGLPLALVLVLRLGVAAFGIAAGIALFAQRPSAVALAKAALLASAAVDVFVDLTPFFPNNRFPGETPYYVAGSIAYCAIWMMYLSRSRRVRNTFGA
jgi:hypothetical protein